MLTAELLRALARESLTDPNRGGTAVMALDPPPELRWTALAGGVTLGVVLAYLLPVLLGQAGGLVPPFMALGLLLGGSVLTAMGMTVVGRMFGGTGRFDDALLLIAWMQWLLIVVQLVQLVALLILPPLAEVVTLFAIGLYFWLLAGFVQALHGFTSRGMVLVGTLGTMFALAILISLLLMALGVDPRVMTDA